MNRRKFMQLTLASVVSGTAGCSFGKNLDDTQNKIILNQSQKIEAPKNFEDKWSIVILPDTQYYSETYPGLFNLQTQWIIDTCNDINTRYVLLPGDITNNNRHREWQNASDALSRLDGKIPYALCTGNHDCGKNGRAKDRTTLMDEYFPYDRLAKSGGITGIRKKGESANTYHLFKDAYNGEWLIITLEWSPRDKTLEWAGKILDKYKNRKAIVLTHAYMYHDSTRYNWKEKGKNQQWNPHSYPTKNGNDGEDIWNKLITNHENVFLVISGHVIGDGTGLLTSKNNANKDVIQMLVNYQSPIEDFGGGAWLRVLTFSKDMEKIKCWTYSPLYKKYKKEKDQLFELIKK
jgi:predicted MPP superfamily phosphohydrolase